MNTLSSNESESSGDEGILDSEEDFVYELEDQRADYEVIEPERSHDSPSTGENEGYLGFLPYSDDPVADKDCTDQYNMEIEEGGMRQQLRERHSGRLSVDIW